ncbi:MAG: phosphoribosylamine--glycine ligase, partial [Deltaproteobacteria bacterium]|nr:phosphoribosylamine--glycine ligase [Deltaproteobacteria bacterium]
GLSKADAGQNVVVFHAGTGMAGKEFVTSGGRVLGVTGLGPDLRTARSHAYEAINSITFNGCYF